MKIIKIDNYIIEEPIINILNFLKLHYLNGKLADIVVSAKDIKVTCPCSSHAGGREIHADCHINLDDTLDDVPYGTVHCFACGFASNLVGFIAEYFDSPREFAKAWLIENFGERAENTILIDDEISINQKSKATYIDESVLDAFQTWTPYLEKRKISRDVCEKFKVRYDPYHRQVIFPIRDIHGKIKMLARRSIDTKIFYMDDNQDKEVYALDIIQKNNIKSCIITEGLFDTLSGWTAGIPTIGTLGEISDYQIAQLNKSCLTTIYTMFDNDSAGKKFTRKIINQTSKRIFVTPIAFPREYKDINDLPKNILQKLYEEATKI